MGGDLPGPLEVLELDLEDREPEPEPELVDPDPELLEPDPEPDFERELEAGELAISAKLCTRSLGELEPLQSELSKGFQGLPWANLQLMCLSRAQSAGQHAPASWPSLVCAVRRPFISQKIAGIPLSVCNMAFQLWQQYKVVSSKLLPEGWTPGRSIPTM